MRLLESLVEVLLVNGKKQLAFISNVLHLFDLAYNRRL